MIRVTEDGQYRPRMMSYWANAFVEGQSAVVFAGHQNGPRFFQVNLENSQVTTFVQLLPYGGETEGWHWRPDGKLYVLDGPRLRCLNPFDRSDDEIVLDISDRFPGCNLWQPHSSDSGAVLSATVQRNEGGKIGTVLQRPGVQEFYGANQALDESQVSRDGRFLLIKEGDDNRILDLEQGSEIILTNALGALGHSDMGHGFAVGENDQIGACVCIADLAQPFDQQRVLFNTWNMGYVSVRGDRYLHSGDTHLSLGDLNGGGPTPLIEHGGSSGYDDRVKANLSPCGRVATYMVNGNVYLLLL